MELTSYDHEEIKFLIDASFEDLNSSKILFDKCQFRNSVVLSYYAMFSIARALLLIKGSQPSTHNGLISEFGRLYVLEEGFDKKLASDFSKARVSRENASYGGPDTFTTFDREFAEYNIDLAERFIDAALPFLEK